MELARKSIRPAEGGPYANVTLAEYKNIRFRNSPGTIHKELLLENLNGVKKWMEFGFGSKGRFPFDEINSMATHQGQLYLGTGIGVQVYGKLPLDLNGVATRLITSGAKKGGGPEPVKWVGLSADPNLPNSMVAVFSNNQLGAAETNNGQKWAKARNPAAANKGRIRAQSPMIRWTQTQSGEIQGVYCNDTGGFDLMNPTYRGF